MGSFDYDDEVWNEHTFLCDFSWRSEQKKSLIMGLHDEERIKRRQSWNFMMNRGTSVANHGISCSTEEKASTVVEIETKRSSVGF